MLHFASQEALDAIFSTSAPQTTSNSMGGRIQGFSGGTGYQQSGSGYAPTGRTSTTMSSGGMTGFGNYDPRAGAWRLCVRALLRRATC